MNNILQIRKRFGQRKSPGKPGARNLPAGASVTAEHIVDLIKCVRRVIDYWNHIDLLSDPLVSIHYTDVVAKSNRIRRLFLFQGIAPNESIVGAKFAEGQKKHIITHCVPKGALLQTVEELESLYSILVDQFEGVITKEELEAINRGVVHYDDSILKKSAFANLVVDSFYVDRVSVEEASSSIEEKSIVSIYDTGVDAVDLLKKLGIDLIQARKIDKTTFLMYPSEYQKLITKAPYLVSMTVKDIKDFVFGEVANLDDNGMATIPEPNDEPTIGVIDSPFDESVYFSKWVDYQSKISKDIEIKPKDYVHGTEVTSIIVDGPSINPGLDDGCGRFRVKHFGVALSGPFSSFSVIRSIREVISDNPDIKVWNLSLGSNLEINENFISPEAAALDQIQFENDVIFVVAGTNNREMKKAHMKIGAPADSINSMVVNAVDYDGNPASYSREGMVLSFYNKPDISYFGGDKSQPMRAVSPLGEAFVTGTSLAAPWISRKLAYLIHVIGLERELAKALVIDSAVGWTENRSPSKVVGYGIVPQRIEDIVHSNDDEIRFLLSGISEQFDTYSYDIPVPVEKNTHPYIARATMCYFPKCSRNQGVDYTNTELDLHFGRIKDDERSSIDTINNNKQSDEGFQNISEKAARSLFRKWDNVKYIVEYMTERKKPKKAYSRNTYGISIKTKERLNNDDGMGIHFGVVITLKELNGRNRIDEFIRQCKLKGWLVTTLDVENRVDIYATAEEEIEFDD